MKFKQFLFKSNRGAALITIMISIAFFAIIASTLLVLSINNYEMKVTKATSKNNFYQTEQNLSLIVADVRQVAKNASSDPTSDIKKAIGGATNATTYNAGLLAKCIDGAEHSVPNGSDCSFTHNGNSITIRSGSILVDTQTAGDKITLKNVNVKMTDQDGFNNEIKTDIVFYVEKGTTGAANTSLGECSFLMDNSISSTSQSGVTIRMQLYGNSILGNYEFKDDHSEGGTVLDLNGVSYINILGDYTVVYGDIVLDDHAVLNVAKGNLSVFGNIYVNGKSAFICNGSLYLGPNSNIYNSDGNSVVSTDKSHNIILSGSITNLTSQDETDLIKLLKLDDALADNDGVVPNIIAENKGKYFYEMTDATVSGCNNFYFDGIKYDVKFCKDNLNTANLYDNKLLFLFPTNTSSLLNPTSPITLNYSTINSTIIAACPIKLEETHSVNVTQIGKAQFDYILNSSSIVASKGGSDYIVKDFFTSDPSAFVNSVFNKSVGGGGGTPTVKKTSVNFENWTKVQ